MNAPKHTQGPWKHIKGGEISATLIHKGGDCIAFVHSMLSHAYAECSVSERDANAALIAAAPDLLSCLKDLLESLEAENQLSYQSGIAAAKLAIAKAEGGAA